MCRSCREEIIHIISVLDAMRWRLVRNNVDSALPQNKWKVELERYEMLFRESSTSMAERAAVIVQTKS